MAEHPGYGQDDGGSSTIEEILAVIAEEPRGMTVEQIARVVDFGWDVALVQDDLEELVEQGLLDRRGIGLGAVYTRNSTT